MVGAITISTLFFPPSSLLLVFSVSSLFTLPSALSFPRSLSDAPPFLYVLFPVADPTSAESITSRKVQRRYFSSWRPFAGPSVFLIRYVLPGALVRETWNNKSERRERRTTALSCACGIGFHRRHYFSIITPRGKFYAFSRRG